MKKSKIFIIGGIVVLLLVAFTILFGILQKFKEFKTLSNKYNLTSNQFILIDRDSATSKINIDSTKFYNIHFFKTSNSSCLSELDSFAKYKAKFNNQELIFISFESPSVVKKHTTYKNYPFQLYSVDSTKLPFTPKSVRYFPFNIFISKSKIISASPGAIEWSQL